MSYDPLKSDLFEAVVAEIDAIPGIQCGDVAVKTLSVNTGRKGPRRSAMIELGPGYMSCQVFRIDPLFVAPFHSRSRDGFQFIAELNHSPSAGAWVQVVWHNKDQPVRRRDDPVTFQFDLAVPGSQRIRHVV